MNNTFFIGDTFMAHRSALTQKEFLFAGAKKLDNGKWEISILIAFINGYAGGSSTVTWEVRPNDKLRVSGSTKGCFLVDGFNKQKVKERPIRELCFSQIEQDKIDIEFIE